MCTAAPHGRSEDILPAAAGKQACRFPRRGKGIYKERRERAGGAMWASALLAVVFSDLKFILQKMFAGRGPKIRLALRVSLGAGGRQ